MAGYIYRGTEPIPAAGFNHGTFAGILEHKRLNTPLCDDCERIRLTPDTFGAECDDGHKGEIDPQGRCRACRREYEATMVRCTGCGHNMTRSSVTRHRARNPDTCRGTAAIPLETVGAV